jgi:micrococcal nuclease
MASTPPEWPPRPRSRTLWSDLGRLWGSFRGLPVVVQLIFGAVAAVVLFWLVTSPFRGDSTNVATQSPTTVRSTLPPSTTTTVVLPPGDDRTVRTVLDGDSFELSDATKIRLIGIDAPDVETDACFSEEATTYLRQVLPQGANVRLVYDTTRTDRFGRTLAYVYRLTDGLFVNVAAAREGFAILLTTPPNTRHEIEIGVAVDEARNGRRGLWQSCTTTTTTARTATTSGTTAGTTSTTGAPATTTTPPRTTVVPGDACLVLGAMAEFADGAPAVCRLASDNLLRWQAA